MKPITQAAVNQNTFDALPAGSIYSVVACGTYRLIEVYVKVDAERVRGPDGRIWPVAYLQSSGVIFTPHGTYTAGQHDRHATTFGMSNEEARDYLSRKTPATPKRKPHREASGV